MTCSKCVFYKPIYNNNYNLSKCAKFDTFTILAKKIMCKGSYFLPATYIRNVRIPPRK